MRWNLLPLAVSVVLLAAACGGGGEEEAEGPRITCKTNALVQQPPLPADFPQPGELTYTKQQKAGPTLIVDGYWSSGLDEAYDELKREVEDAGYKILFSEREEDDAEISYEASQTTGQIALRGDCSEEDTTRVHITNRPK